MSGFHTAPIYCGKRDQLARLPQLRDVLAGKATQP